MKNNNEKEKYIINEKYVFWDIDGTLTAFGEASGNPWLVNTNDEFLAKQQILNWIDCDSYKDKTVIQSIKQYIIKQTAERKDRVNFILSKITYGREVEDKKRFIRRNFTEKEFDDTCEYYVTANEQKVEVIKALMFKYSDMTYDNTILIDDDLKILKAAYNAGIKVLHPTFLMK